MAESFEEWEFKAKGTINENNIFLLGTSHLELDLPLVEDAFKKIKPTLVLMELYEKYVESGSVSVEYGHAIKLARKAKIEMGFFDIDPADIFKKIVKETSIYDGFAVFSSHQIPLELVTPTLPVGKALVAAIKADSKPHIEVLTEKWMEAFAFIFVVFIYGERDAFNRHHKLTHSKYYMNYVKRMKKDMSFYYNEITGKTKKGLLATDEKDLKEFEKGKAKLAKEENISPNFEKAHNIWIGYRNEKFLENIKNDLRKKEGENVLIMCGYVHFDALKKELKLKKY